VSGTTSYVTGSTPLETRLTHAHMWPEKSPHHCLLAKAPPEPLPQYTKATGSKVETETLHPCWIPVSPYGYLR
jgi:hypothetical protein